MEDFLPKTDLYRLFLFASVATLIGFGIFAYYRPIITEAGCSEIAAKAMSVGIGKSLPVDPNLNYDYIKIKCLEDTKN